MFPLTLMILSLLLIAMAYFDDTLFLPLIGCLASDILLIPGLMIVGDCDDFGLILGYSFVATSLMRR